MQWKIGDVEVQLVREVAALVPAEGMYVGPDLAPLEANASWLRPHFLTEDGMLTLSIHALVLRSMGQVIVVDTCVGEHVVPGHEAMAGAQGPFLADLEAAGVRPEDVDVVLCTHLHFDHVGWNTHLVDGRWVPTFPNARYLFGRVEHEHWATGAAGYALTFGDAVQPVVEAGLADLVEMDHVVNDEIRLEPTPGHSPGHVSVVITSQGERAVITGDLLHHPVQFVAPDWVHIADADAARASRTRIEFRDRYADTGTRIFGTHFGGPSCGHLVRDGDGYRFDV